MLLYLKERVPKRCQAPFGARFTRAAPFFVGGAEGRIDRAYKIRYIETMELDYTYFEADDGFLK
jgi:hypothetical protein